MLIKHLPQPACSEDQVGVKAPGRPTITTFLPPIISESGTFFGGNPLSKTTLGSLAPFAMAEAALGALLPMTSVRKRGTKQAKNSKQLRPQVKEFCHHWGKEAWGPPIFMTHVWIPPNVFCEEQRRAFGSFHNAQAGTVRFFATAAGCSLLECLTKSRKATMRQPIQATERWCFQFVPHRSHVPCAPFGAFKFIPSDFVWTCPDCVQNRCTFGSWSLAGRFDEMSTNWMEFQWFNAADSSGVYYKMRMLFIVPVPEPSVKVLQVSNVILTQSSITLGCYNGPVNLRPCIHDCTVIHRLYTITSETQFRLSGNVTPHRLCRSDGCESTRKTNHNHLLTTNDPDDLAKWHFGIRCPSLRLESYPPWQCKEFPLCKCCSPCWSAVDSRPVSAGKNSCKGAQHEISERWSQVNLKLLVLHTLSYRYLYVAVLWIMRQHDCQPIQIFHPTCSVTFLKTLKRIKTDVDFLPSDFSFSPSSHHRHHHLHHHHLLLLHLFHLHLHLHHFLLFSPLLFRRLQRFGRNVRQ